MRLPFPLVRNGDEPEVERCVGSPRGALSKLPVQRMLFKIVEDEAKTAGPNLTMRQLADKLLEYAVAFAERMFNKQRPAKSRGLVKLRGLTAITPYPGLPTLG